jgi:hypothetical protein
MLAAGKISIPHLTGNALALLVCVAISYLVWQFGAKFDHRLTAVMGIVVGLILSTTSMGPHLDQWMSTLTHGYLA